MSRRLRVQMANLTLGTVVMFLAIAAVLALVLATGHGVLAALLPFTMVPLIGATNEVFDRAIALNVVLDDPASAGTSSSPGRVGPITGVLVAAQAADGSATLALRGGYSLSVKGVNDAGNSAVAVGDAIFYVDADTPKLSKKSSGRLFGYALAAITSGSTATINVLLDDGTAAVLGSLDLPPDFALTTTGAVKTGALTVTSAAAAALAVGRQGATSPALNVDASAATSVTGFNVAAAAAGGGLAVSVIGGNAAENLAIDAKGSGTITLGGTSTGGISLARAVTAALGLLVNGTGALGYGTGSGGAVTQITNSATGVTINKTNGQITTVALTTSAGAEEEFTVTNSQVAATDTIALSTTYAGAGTPMVGTSKIGAGTFDIIITNLHATAAFNAAMTINFAVIKAVAA